MCIILQLFSSEKEKKQAHYVGQVCTVAMFLGHHFTTFYEKTLAMISTAALIAKPLKNDLLKGGMEYLKFKNFA